jgi:hypothetical protein
MSSLRSQARKSSGQKRSYPNSLRSNWVEKPWVANQGVLKSKELTSRAGLA